MVKEYFDFYHLRRVTIPSIVYQEFQARQENVTDESKTCPSNLLNICIICQVLPLSKKLTVRVCAFNILVDEGFFQGCEEAGNI